MKSPRTCLRGWLLFPQPLQPGNLRRPVRTGAEARHEDLDWRGVDLRGGDGDVGGGDAGQVRRGVNPDGVSPRIRRFAESLPASHPQRPRSTTTGGAGSHTQAAPRPAGGTAPRRSAAARGARHPACAGGGDRARPERTGHQARLEAVGPRVQGVYFPFPNSSGSHSDGSSENGKSLFTPKN